MSKLAPNLRVARTLAEALQRRSELQTGHDLDTCSAVDCGVGLCDDHRRLLRAHLAADYLTGSVIYFAVLTAPATGDWRGGLVKIGITFDIEQRMRGLHARAIVSHRGDLRAERDYHELLAADRVRGEWFRPSYDVIRVMRSIGRAATQDWLASRAA